MTQPSRSMSLWKNPDSPLGITGFKDRLNTLMGKNSIRRFASECGKAPIQNETDLLRTWISFSYR
ncbi:hypothetical protein [Providencia hangzhouensis]|uniref:hypothetical protein n=1 Tax=Providencia TaxID=586 RepID=UPI0033481342